MLLSIVIVSYNACEYLKRCLHSIPWNNEQIETIVVDNGSTDNSLEMIEKDFKSAICVQGKSNLGFGAGNNLGVKQARGKYILLLNSDAVLYKDTTEKIISIFEEIKNKGNNIGILGIGLENDLKEKELAFGFFPTVFNMGERHKNKVRKAMSSMQTAKAYSVEWVTGACVLMERDFYNQIQGFDEKIFLYFEDVELCKRIWKQDKEVWYHNEILALHSGGKSTKLDAVRKSWRRKSVLYYLRKHFSWSSLVLMPLHYFRKIG